MRRTVLLLACMLVAACSQWSYRLGEPLEQSVLEDLAVAEDLGVALSLLGPPQRLAAVADGYVLGWEHWRISENSLGISLGALGADVLAIDWGEARLAGEFLLLRFDSEHRLTARAFNTWDERGGGGGALQPSVALVDVVDVGDLLKPLPAHRWGKLSTGRLPASLNRDSSPDSGSVGLEQRGTPTGAGQRSLEMLD